MKSLRAIVCVVVGLVILGFVVGQVCAELPWTREIRDKVKWGDPDCPWAKSPDGSTHASASIWGENSGGPVCGVGYRVPQPVQIDLGLGVNVLIRSAAETSSDAVDRRGLR